MNVEYTVDDVSVILEIDPESVRRWIRDGALEARMTHPGTGGGYRISHEALERFVQERHPYLTLNTRKIKQARLGESSAT